ncbi:MULTISPECIES: hypothetical protein [Rhodopseudomonas]|uniref:Uncharacterized protein n=1 Tax=Rhodopseudomonas palustris TaxID=1076 RepID=A0A0D7F6Q5_RHOPL|nr:MULTISPECIES: hypothetical protein [Rhodopseudomonas]KIZ47397.1 hypothetical protein OO17_04630 [Rhodopseudomonas palustris]MDF3809258.1 hypothetical protein [Rhodopseudomonas sp. BAL398]WOK19057.1 hypothetical protein RBJ75_05935 [Rhodopseudomonas sp. BAL398]
MLRSLSDKLDAYGRRTIAEDDAMGVAYAADLAKAAAAAERQTRLVDTINARENALAEAADHRIRTVREQTGLVLENPFSGGYLIDANRRVDDARARGETIDNRSAAVQEQQRAIFTEKIDEAAQNFPDKAPALSFGQSLEDQARAISAGAAYDGEHAPGGVGPFLASIAGGLWGSRRDPLFVGSLFIGPGLSAARSALGAIGMGALKQGLFNAGLQAAAQPAVQDWRRAIGEKSGVVPALENVGLAFLFGAIPGAAIEGARVLTGAHKAAIGRLADGTANPGDAALAAQGLGVKLDDETARSIRTGEADQAHAVAAAADRPADVPPQQHDEIVAQAIRHAEDPAVNPPPDLPTAAPPRAADQAAVVDETIAARLGDRHTIDGKPVTFARFDPAQLTTDAAAFQYKGGGDAAGVTDRLKNVSTYDPLASGKTLVFERRDGSQVIADGHQRLGLAKRLGADDASIKLDGFLFRERDGWTAEDVRAMAAKKNMQEGSGDALDAARILRDRPDLLDGSMPLSSPMMKNAIALSRLSDEAFGMAINGVVPPNYAAAVGAMVPDRLQHGSVVADLARLAPETEREARLLIGEIMASGFRAEEQINLFGAAEATRSLMGERVKVLDAALVGLSRDKKLFGTLAAKADAIEAAGNQLAREGNDARARDAAQLQDMLTRLARRTGPVSDALNRAAAQMADGMKPGKAADGFLEDVRALLDRDGLAGLLADPELKPRLTVEPGTPDALAAAETANTERQDGPDLFGGTGRTAEPASTKTSPEPSVARETAIQDQGRQAVFEDVASQLRAAGIQADQIDANAAVFAARYATRAQRLGEASAWEAYVADGLTIRRGETGTAKGVGVFQQSDWTPRIVSSKEMQLAVLRNEWQRHGPDLDYEDVLAGRSGDKLWRDEVNAWNEAHGTSIDPDPNATYKFGSYPDFEKHFEAKHLDGKKAPFPGVKKANDYFEFNGNIEHTAYLRGQEPTDYQQAAGAAAARGKITVFRDNSAIIDLFARADQSTFMHEAGHLWLGELVRDAEKAPALARDLDAVLQWFGIDDAGKIELKHHEQWARGFEEYLREGKAPSSALARAFDAFKSWLTTIYRSLSDLGPDRAPLSDDVRGVMDRLLASDAEISARKPATLFEALAVSERPDGRDTRFISRDAALAEADKSAEHADLVASCKG